MKIKYLKVAKEEFDDSIRYYENQVAGLGHRFKDDVEASVRRILNYPKAFSNIGSSIRRCLLHRFPHSILYSIEED